MRVQKMVPEMVIASCPDCEIRKQLVAEPQRGDFWPHCDECGSSMNVYVRGRIEDDKTEDRQLAK